MQVDPVKQRAGQFRPILLDLLRRADAFALVAGAVNLQGQTCKFIGLFTKKLPHSFLNFLRRIFYMRCI